MLTRTLIAFLTVTLLMTPALAFDNGEARLEAGYRLTDDDGAARVSPYEPLTSSPILDLLASRYGKNGHVSLDAWLRSDRDYNVELHLDGLQFGRGQLRLENFVHNLDHLPYANRPDADTNPAGATPRATFTDQNPNAEYRLDIGIQEARFQGRLKTYPAHVRIGYWRLEREGTRQQRFVSEQCTGCHVQSRSIKVDQVTEEVTAGIDAHLGPVDVIVEQLYRQFNNRKAAPVDSFDSHTFFRPAAADLEHDSIPDSRSTETTLKLHTSLSGGLVGAASASIGKRENRGGERADTVSPVISSTDVAKGAGDLTWIPHPSWTFNLRYRLLDLDNSNSATLNVGGLNPAISTIEVRNNPDLRRDSWLASATYRPNYKLSVQARFDREIIHRDQTGPAQPYISGKVTPFPPFLTGQQIDPVWDLPRQEQNDRIKLTVMARPLGNSSLRLHSWWELRTSSDPAYGTSFDESHRLFFSANYQPTKGFWGANLVADRSWQSNDQIEMDEFDEVTGLPVTFDLGRQKRQTHLDLGAWLRPLDQLQFGASIGWLDQTIEQDLIFGNEPPDYAFVDEGVRYDQTSHTLSAYLDWRPCERWGLNLAGHLTRSRARFNPQFARTFAGIYNADSTGLAEISRVSLQQLGVSAAVDWQLSDSLGCRLEYGYDDYEDRTGDSFDGQVQTCQLSLSYVW